MANRSFFNGEYMSKMEKNISMSEFACANLR